MEKKARQPYIFTADSVTSGLYAPAHHAPDLQGNYHALIRESTARETIRFTMSTPFCAVCIKLYIIFDARKERIESWSKLQKLLTLKSYRCTYVISFA